MEAPTIRRFYSPYEGREPVGFASGPGCAASAPALGAVGRALHDVRKKGVRHGVPFQRTPRAQKDRARRRHRSNPHLRVVPSGMPRGRSAASALFVKDGELVKVEGDDPDHQLTQGRLCPRCLALKEAVYHPDRILYPHEARPQGPRPGQVGAHHVGRSHRPRRHQDRGDPREVRLRGHLRVHGNRPRGRALRLHPVLQSAAHAEQLLRAVRLVVHGPAPDGHDHDAGQRLHRTGLQRRIARRVGRPRVEAPRLRVLPGQGTAQVQPRRPVGPCAHRTHEARQQAHHGGPAPELAGHACGTGVADHPRHRRRPVPGHPERARQRGSGGPRLHREMVLRLRRAGGTRAGIHAPNSRRPRAASRPRK